MINVMRVLPRAAWCPRRVPPPLRQPTAALLARAALTASVSRKQVFGVTQRSSFLVDQGATTASGTKAKVVGCEIHPAPSLSTPPSPPHLTSPLLANAGAHSKEDRDRLGRRPCDYLRQWSTLVFLVAEATSNLPPCPMLSPSGASQDANLLQFSPSPQPSLAPVSTCATPGAGRLGRPFVCHDGADFPPTSKGLELRLQNPVRAPRRLLAMRLVAWQGRTTMVQPSAQCAGAGRC